MKDSVIIVGAGGHARVIMSLIAYTNWSLIGLFDRNRECQGEAIRESKIVGSFDELPDWYSRGVRRVALALGDNAERAGMFVHLRGLGFEIVDLQHPSAIVERDVQLGQGVVICAGAILCAGVRIGDNVIINTAASVDHETNVHAHAHIAPGARLAGRVTVGETTFIGIGAVVADKRRVGAGSIIGAGSVVISDVPDNVVAYGVPARIQRLR